MSLSVDQHHVPVSQSKCELRAVTFVSTPEALHQSTRDQSRGPSRSLTWKEPHPDVGYGRWAPGRPRNLTN
ncbi:hypothetical protein IAQ61_009229 [Plenodomus lingam]|uniref:uncharacterized protein n=1 Tax=Leptosphaeria maculans TaxID=5022 RepID=UPI003321C401|nr:hypothetical protein IAQ61_009229 [Plenodomus lingam]